MPRTIVAVLQQRASSPPGPGSFTFLGGAPLGPRTITFAQLDARARDVAAHLLEAGLRGERALLLYPPGLEFIEAFFGCLYAGVVAVPAFPPRAGRTIGRLRTMAADAQACAALTTDASIERSKQTAAEHARFGDLRWIATDRLPSGNGSSIALPAAGAGDLAYLQYTSGSTSEPKGVMVSHANIVANSEAIRRGFDHTRESVSLCWLPHFHDMGLVDGIIQPIYSGFRAFLMGATTFLQSPARWFEAIAAHAVTHTGGPNFAYDLCARRVEPDPSRYDLRSWAVATNGAEPVRAETLERFASRFARCGFRRAAFYPAYGLAEATLKVSGGAPGEGPIVVRANRAALEAGIVREEAEGAPLVGSGRPAEGAKVAIVDPESRVERPEGEIGEIWVTGEVVALGYWRRPAETERTFGARLAGDPRSYLRTGDLGFVRNGELFVTGRAKDMVIVRGRNIYPQDVEQTAAFCSAALRPAGGAAFGIEVEGEERLVLVHEIDRHGAEPEELVLQTIRAAIVDAHEVDPHALVLVRAGGVPRTSSGKVRRGACRAAFLEGSLPVVAEWRAPAAPAEAAADVDERDVRGWIAARIAAKLGVAVEAIDFEASLARHGLDSLRAIELAHEIGERFGVEIPITDLLGPAPIARLAARVERRARPEGRARVGRAAAEAPTGTARADAAPAEVSTGVEKPGDAAAEAPIGMEPRTEIGAEPEDAPLSAGQKALWFLHEMAPDSSAYTIASALRLTGALDAAALGRAARALVARHASLRARIVQEEAEPRQRFDVPFDAIWSYAELPAHTVDEIASLLDREAHRPFDLARGPLVRLRLFRTDGGHILLMAAHHAVADLWSLSVALGDLRSLYAAELGLAAPPIGAPPHPIEHVLWQQRLLAGEDGERQFAFWRGELAGEVTALDLPADRQRPAVQTFRGAARTFSLEPELASRIRMLARARGVTLYALLLSAYGAFLGRITGQRDILIGSPATGRTNPRFSGLTGFLVNTVVMRADLSADPPFETLLAATWSRVLAVFANQDYPFAALVKRLAPRRDASRSPFFDTMFDLHATGEIVRGDLGGSAAGAAITFAGGIRAEALPIARRASQFDLSVTATDDGSGLSLEWEYNADLFDAATIDRLARAYTALLEAAAADPSTRVSRLRLLSSEERAAALRDMNADPAVEPAACVHRLIERQAAERPHAVAVRHRGAGLSYGELNRRANLLARRLRESGAGPETPIALVLEKSVDLVVAIVGVLKSGGAYLPIDPALPNARIRFLIGDARARVVLMRGPREDLDEPDLVVLDESAWSPVAGSESGGAGIDDGAGPANLAYVIYTSGTTGTPKGVGVTHASLFGAFRAWERAYGLDRLASHLQMAAPGFDVFTGDLVRALCSGGTLVLCDRETLLDPPALAALAREERVEFAEFVPATLRELAAHLVRTGERIDSLRVVAVGSDVWTLADLEIFRRALGPHVRLVNSYGVTEATIDSTIEDPPAGGADHGTPAIGRPLSNTAAYVLDAHLEPLPAGVRGELFLGGPAVARGYVQRPDLTADRFLPDPHGSPGDRLYRTGDAARRLADGRIVFAGRTDAQVKIRGHRIEPAEIEAALEAHQSVLTCAVVARAHAAGPRLAAYIVLREPDSNAPAALRAHLAGRLPDAMIPHAIVPLAALPLTPNGKVDRRALPEPDWSAGGAAGGEEEPGESAAATETERALARIWSRILGVGGVGMRDNFFELGGDSIIGIQVVTRAREAGIPLTPRMLFESPTVEGLARAAAAAAGRDDSQPVEIAGEAALTPIQSWFLAREFDEPDHWNMAIALDAREKLDAARARIAADAIVARHPSLRARFQREGGAWRQTIEESDLHAAEPIHLDAAAGEPRDEAIARCARNLDGSLDIARGPTVRFGLVDGEDWTGTTLIIVAHHLVVDGVSLRILAEDFERAYGQTGVGERPSLLPEIASSGAWAAALAEGVRAGLFADTADRWSRLARTDLPPPPLGGDGVPPLEETTRIATTELDEEATRALMQGHVLPGARVDELLLAALADAWGRWTGSGSFLVEVERHGRDLLPEVDLSRTVGWFTETFPLLIEGIDPSRPEATLAAVVRARRETAEGGFGPLREHAPDAELRALLGNAPTPPVSFNYLGRFDADLEEESLFTRVSEPASPRRSPRARRTHAIEVDSAVVGGRLTVRWSYSRAQLEPARIAGLETAFERALRAIIEGSTAGLARDRDVEAVLPLTPMQEGMLFHHLRAVDRDPYVSQIVLEMTGEIDAGVLARAWRTAFDAHPAMRAEFVWEGLEQPLQVIRRSVVLPVAIHEGTQDRLAEIRAAALAKGFEVARAPLARIDIVQTGARQVSVVFTHHHLLLDGWSLPLFLGTVFDAYDALAEGRLVPQADLGALRRYAAWLAESDREAAERFFRKELAGFGAPTPMPDPGRSVEAAGDARADEPVEARAAATGASVDSRHTRQRSASSGVLQAPAPAEVAARARALGLTPGTVMQAAWALVLAASSDKRDVVFGTTSSGRPPEVEGIGSLVGLCINTLPMRIMIDPGARAGDWMHDLQRRGALLRQYEHASLALVQRCAATAPNTQLFESLLVFENYPLDLAALAKRARFDVTAVGLHEETNYPLTIVAVYEDGLHFRAVYDRGRYDEAGVRLVLGRLSAAIDGLLLRPEATLGEIPVLAAGEEARLLEAATGPRREFPREATIAALFDRVAREREGAEALIFDGGSITYDELRAGARTLAAALRQRGVGPEVRVALAMDRSPELIEAILGVLYAGGAYVPIDPQSPPARTTAMLRDAGVELVVTGGNVGILGAQRTALEGVTLDALRAEGSDTGEASRIPGHPNGIAYVMFTSGSTGEPKGIEITNASVVALISCAEYLRLDADQTNLHIASPAFDASTFEIWGALLRGGRLAIAPPGAASAAEIARLLARFDVTTVLLSAGLFHVVADEERAALARVPQVMAGGDVLSPPHVRSLLDAGCATFVDAYGPTEVTVMACCEVLAPGASVAERVPIGRPIANVRVYALDAAMRFVPIGAPGELYVGGEGVARGYAQRPDLTAERFLPDPFEGRGARIYRTGDMVRWRADGRLEFLGRRDGQIKVRGFRVEIGEVEAALAELPGVRAAAVTASQDADGAALTGFIVAGDGAAHEAGAIRSALAPRLPRYMIPARFVVLEALPLTANGKVDRRALAERARRDGGAADAIGQGSDAMARGPRAGAIALAGAGSSDPSQSSAMRGRGSGQPPRALTPVEEALADLWRRVLGIAELGPDDDFFELGGHSLLATRLLGQIRRTFRVEIPMAALFDATTVAGLARTLVAHEPEPGHVERAARALAKLRTMANEDRLRMLAGRSMEGRAP